MNSVSTSTDINQARTEHEILATNLTINFQCNYGIFVAVSTFYTAM